MKTVRISRIMATNHAAALAAYWVRKYVDLTMVVHLESGHCFISADVDDVSDQMIADLKNESEVYCTGYTDRIIRGGKQKANCGNVYQKGYADGLRHLEDAMSVLG